jgi:hypothetical protein
VLAVERALHLDLALLAFGADALRRMGQEELRDLMPGD